MLRKRHLFSLIELLIVISIFGILVSLLQPSLVSMLNVAESTKCTNRMRQVNTGVQLYLEDHNEMFWAEAGLTWWKRQWHESLLTETVHTQQDNINNYIESRDILLCPMGNPDKFHRYTTYGFLSRGNMNFRDFNSPSTQFILGDSMFPNGVQTLRIFRNNFHSYYGGLSSRHLNGSITNIMHYDGHVGSYSLDELNQVHLLSNDTTSQTFSGVGIYKGSTVLPYNF